MITIEPSLSDIKISIKSGHNKPYRFKNKKKASFDNVYIRSGSTKRPASNDEINRMIKKYNPNSLDSEESPTNLLTFTKVDQVFKNLEINFDDIGLGLKKRKSEKFNYAAFLISDENDNIAKLAVFDGLDVDNFKDKKEFRYSIVEQIDRSLEAIDLYNRKSISFTGQGSRKEVSSFPEIAIREAIVNAFVHRDYTLTSDIKIEIFDDRLTISSPGSLPDGLTVNDIKEGANAKRNPILINILDKLGYIENYGSGIRRIFSSYKDFHAKPELIATHNQFKVMLYDRNYKRKPLDVSSGILNYLKENEPASRLEIQNNLNLQKSYTLELINELKEKHLIESIGAGRSTKYRTIDD